MSKPRLPCCWRDLVSSYNDPPALTRGDPCACGVGDGLGLEFDNGDRICYSCGRPLIGGQTHGHE